MRFIILSIVCIFICQPVSSQENIPVETANITQKNVKLVDLTIDELKERIYHSTKNTKVIYFYRNSNTCEASRLMNPAINELYLKHKDKFDLFVVSRANKKNKESLHNYLFFEGYYFPVYMIGRNSFRSMFNKLCPDCNHRIIGYSGFFILDSNNTLLNQTNYDLSKDEKIQMLSSYLD